MVEKKKSELIKLILNYQKTENTFTLEKNKIVFQLLENFNEIQIDIQNYKHKCAVYLKNVDDTLDKSVYGMKDAKLQIKRVIAQWINGTNQGYIFGFEGPPGMGKTTLAKLEFQDVLKIVKVIIDHFLLLL